MTPVERLQAAIEKLERLRSKVPESGEREWRQASNRRGWIVAHDGTPVAQNLTQSDVDMILTLHRTIDAQLAILRDVLEAANLVYTLNALALADAILGGDS